MILGPDEAVVVEAVLARPGSSGNDLASEMGLRRGVTLAVLRLLRARGLVRAVPRPRRRVRWYPQPRASMYVAAEAEVEALIGVLVEVAEPSS